MDPRVVWTCGEIMRLVVALMLGLTCSVVSCTVLLGCMQISACAA